MGFSRREYWSRLLFPPPGIFLTRGSNLHLPCLLHCRLILYQWATGKAQIGWLHFLIMEKWVYVGDSLWRPAAHSSLFPWALCSKNTPCVGCTCPSVVMGPTTVDTLVSGAAPWPRWLPGSAWFGACELLMGEARPQGGWLYSLGMS